MREVPTAFASPEQPQVSSQSLSVSVQASPPSAPFLPNFMPVSGSSASDPELIDMQKRFTALKTGQPAVMVSGIEGQGIVQNSTAETNDENQEKWYTPASATLPYPGLDGHPRRITPIPVSVTMSDPVTTVKTPDQLRRETAELIQRLENEKRQRKFGLRI